MAKQSDPWRTLPVLIGVNVCFALGCGRAHAPTPAATVESSSQVDASANQSGDSPTNTPREYDEEAELMRQIEEQEQLAEAEAQPQSNEAKDDLPKREVVYRMSGNNMRIEIEGVEFHPQAQLVKLGSGYGIKVSVEATTQVVMNLLSPKDGPLAFGGTVYREQPEKFGDTRQGEKDVLLRPGTPTNFRRNWPAPGQAPLREGERLELQVGLWGLGTSISERRPVRKFFVIKVEAAKEGAVPYVEPPSM